MGSGVFENREDFLREIRLAVTEIEARGKRVTQVRVADILSQRVLSSEDSAERQLRRWGIDFGFADWRDLLNNL